MKVMKFGGSTIKNPDMMKRVVKTIKEKPGAKAVVVSALHRQTNDIREFLATIRTESNEIQGFMGKVLNKHEFMVKNTISEAKIRDNVLDRVTNLCLKLERLLFGVAYTEELTPRTRDLILSSAERLSAYIIEGALLESGVSAKAYEADSIGIVTDGVFGNATADLKKCEENLKMTIQPRISAGEVPVITGFFGCDLQGRTTTFGKNGSDYSAAVVAYALDGECLELWKDVDGFMTANPYLVSDAKTIDELSYNEAAELAYFGNDLLHPRTVGPVRLKGIPILIKNILNPRVKGTMIGERAFESTGTIKSVAYSNDLAEVRISGSWAGYRSGTLAKISGILGQHDINVFSVTTSHTQLSILVSRDDIKRCLDLLEGICGSVIEKVTFNDDVALVCVVGEGAGNKKGLAAGIFSAVSGANVNISTISAGASDVAAHFIIKKDDLQRTLSAIHSAFCIKTS